MLEIESLLQGTPNMWELKEKYYKLLIRFHANSDSYLEICRCYRNLYLDMLKTKTETPEAEAPKSDTPMDTDAWMPVLKKIIW